MVNSAQGFDRQTLVINRFSELILDVFGPEIGRHVRSAVGMADLPFKIAVEVEAELTIVSWRVERLGLDPVAIRVQPLPLPPRPWC